MDDEDGVSDRRILMFHFRATSVQWLFVGLILEVSSSPEIYCFLLFLHEFAVKSTLRGKRTRRRKHGRKSNVLRTVSVCETK